MNEQALLAAIGSMMEEKLEAGLKPIKEDIAGIRGRLDKIEDRLDKVEGQTGRIEMQATRLGVIVENEVDRAVKLLGEGHEGILETIKRDFASAEELEKDRIRLFSLEETARKHTRQIENLQKRTG